MNIKVLALSFSVLALSGCGDTTVIKEPDRVIEKKVEVKNDKVETKEKTVRENADGSTTKIEKKTETK